MFFLVRRIRRMKKPRRLISYLVVALLAILLYSSFHHHQQRSSTSLRTARSAAARGVDHAWGSIIYRFQNHPQSARRRRRFPWTESSLFSSTTKALLLRKQQQKPGDHSAAPVIRTLIVTSELVGLHANGGIGTAFAELASRLALQSNMRVEILIPKLASEFPLLQRTQVVDTLAKENIVLHFIPAAARPRYPLGWSPLASISVLDFLRLTDGSYDIVHFAENSGIGYFSLLAKREGLVLQSSKVVVGLHGAQVEWASMMNKRYPSDEFDVQLGVMERRSAEWADVVVSPSEYMVEYVAARGWALPEHTLVIPNIVQSSAHSSVPSSSDEAAPLLIMPILPDSLPPPVTELVFFGRLEERKGTRLFVEALELLLVKDSTFDVPRSIEMITFLGKDAFDSSTGVEASVLITQALLHLQLVSSHAFKFQFHSDFDRQQAIDYLRKPTRLAVLPALADNSPSTVLECIANGIRFLASTSGGIGELVHEDDHPFVLFEPRASSFAASLSRTIAGSDGRMMIRAAENTRTAADDWVMLHDWIFSTLAATSSSLSAPSSLSSSTSRTPLVSICITHYERPAFLVQLLDSLRRQSYTTFEVVIVDDGSTSLAALDLLDQLQLEYADLPNWSLFRTNNSYLGEARNRAAAQSKGEYLLFLDDDDVLKSHALQTLVSVALHTKASALSTWLDEFNSDLDPTHLEVIPHRRTFWFTGQSTALGMMENCFGSGNIFVTKAAFNEVGGFSTFREVGAEDWEFYMKLATNGLSQLVVPEELIYVRSSPNRLSMKFTMNGWDSSYRALLPLINDPRVQQLDLAPSLLFAKASMTRTFKEPPFANSRSDFETIQGWNGWSYAFESVGPRSPNLEPGMTDAVGGNGRWDMRLPESQSYIVDSAQKPFVSKKGNHRYTAVRTFTSPRAIDVTLRLNYHAQHQCGDGTELQLIFRPSSTEPAEELMVRRTMDRGHDVYQKDISLREGSTLSLTSFPLDSDECDHVEVDLTLAPTKTSKAWSTLARRAQAEAAAQAIRNTPEPSSEDAVWSLYSPETFDPATMFSIALIFDSNRLDYAQQVIRSAVHFITSRILHIHLICPLAMHTDLFAAFADSAVVVHIYDHQLCVDAARDILPFSDPDIHVSAHCKFFLSEIVTDVDRVLYLDTDTSILNDISACYSIPTSPATLISMAVDMGDTCQLNPSLCWPIGHHSRIGEGLKCGNVEGRPMWNRNPEVCGEEGELETFQLNGGVVLLELDRMRESNFVERYIASIIQHYRIVGRGSIWGEQDFINSYFRLYPQHLRLLPCGCNYQWFGARREVRCGEQPLYIAHSWSHGLAARSEDPFNVLFYHFYDNIASSPPLSVPIVPTISLSAFGSKNESIVAEYNFNCPLQQHDCSELISKPSQYGSAVFVLSRAVSGHFSADLVDSLASQSYSNLRHGFSKPVSLQVTSSPVTSIFIDSPSDLDEDYAMLCDRCSALAAAPDRHSCHLPPTSLPSPQRKAYFDCFCTTPDSTSLSRFDLEVLAVAPGWIMYLDDDRMFATVDSVAHLMSNVDSIDQLIVFRSNSTAGFQESGYRRKVAPKGELDGTGFLYHSSQLNLTMWDHLRCGIATNFERLSENLRIKWIDLVPTIEHPLARHVPRRSISDLRITVIVFESLDHPLWIEQIVVDLTSRPFSSIVEEVVVVSQDRKEGSLGSNVRILNVEAGSGLTGLAGIAKTEGVLVLRDSIRLNKVSLTALLNFWLDDPRRLVGIFTPPTSSDFPPPSITDQSIFRSYNEIDSLVGSNEYVHLLPRLILAHASHLNSLAKAIASAPLHPICHNILLHALSASEIGHGPLRVLPPVGSLVDRVWDCRIRSWADITEGRQAGDAGHDATDDLPTYEMCLSHVGRMMGNGGRKAWLLPSSEVGISGVQGMKLASEVGEQVSAKRWDSSRKMEKCLRAEVAS